MTRSEPVQPSLGQLPDIILIAGTKTKLTGAAPARELYTGSLFRKARSYAEQSGVLWFIISAQHGLVRAEEVLDPYDCSQGDQSAPARGRWAVRVGSQLEDALGGLSGKTIEVHTGSTYAGPLREVLSTLGMTVAEPLAGLGLGRRLGWYDRRLASSV